jgi:hypothetical protein
MTLLGITCKLEYMPLNMAIAAVSQLQSAVDGALQSLNSMLGDLWETLQ